MGSPKAMNQQQVVEEIAMYAVCASVFANLPLVTFNITKATKTASCHPFARRRVRSFLAWLVDLRIEPNCHLFAIL
jgi:hypothetical protein